MVQLLPSKYKGENERAPYDQYFTPYKPVYAFCKAVSQYSGIIIPETILDPCAGEGMWGTVYKEEIVRGQANLVGVDIDGSLQKPNSYNEWYSGVDFLETDWEDRKFELIISNPPFNKSEKFINKCWDMLEPHGTMAFMLNLTFLGSLGRKERLFTTNRAPSKVIVSSRRIDFTGQGRPHTEVGMFIWNKFLEGFDSITTEISWLDWEEVYEEEKNWARLGWSFVSVP